MNGISIGGCVFCGIATGAVPSTPVYESANVLAVMDVRPVSPGHLLVIPKAHYTAISDLPGTLFDELAATAHAFARALSVAFPSSEGMNLLMSEGAVASQSVFHSHLHVIPRMSGDSMRLSSDDPVAARGALEVAAARWREVIADGDGCATRQAHEAGGRA